MTTKSGRRLLVAALGAVLLAACSSVKVSVDWDREANFASYHTFAFLKREGRGVRRPMSPLLRKNAESAIRAELTAKGLQ